jgi:hypothetical protein
VAEGRGSGLCEGWAECAGGIGGRRRIDVQLRMAGGGEMAELVINRPLLRRQQQQQQTECLVHLACSTE